MHIIKTSHIAKQSIREIKKHFKDEKPDIVAIELDKARLAGLLDKSQKKSFSPAMIKHIGVMGYLFGLIGSFLQQKLGKFVGIEPGAEMLTAFKEAQKSGCQVFLIDQDIRVTLKKLSKKVPLSEKLKIPIEIVKGPFQKEKIKIDLNKVPQEQLVVELMKQFKGKFPNMYNVLVKERNEIMSKRIEKIKELHPNKKLLVVVGAGHDV